MKHQQHPIPAILTIALSTLFFIGCSKSGTKPIPQSTGPAITYLSGYSGAYTTNVTINGTDFSGTAANDQVFFNGVAAAVTAVNSTQIFTSVPLAAGTGNITLIINGITVKGPVFTYLPSLMVSAFAGSSQAGSANGMGTAATFFEPNGIAADATGNLYVADEGNHLIRKITPAGLVSTFAGTGTAGYADGTGTAASFNSPAGVAV